MIGAHSVSGSKFKLLMFEATEEGQWELLLQEDSIKVTPQPLLSSQYFDEEFPWCELHQEDGMKDPMDGILWPSC